MKPVRVQIDELRSEAVGAGAGIVVELRGEKARLEVREGDEPEEVAMDFCLENDLPEDVVVPLINHIRENLKQSCVKAPEAALKASRGSKGIREEASSAAQNRRNRMQALRPLSPPHSSKSQAAAQGSQQNQNVLQTSTPDSDSAAVPPVFDRLYARAKEVQQKLDQRRREKLAAQASAMQPKGLGMTRSGRQLSLEQSLGDFTNYGEKLYLEGLHELEKRRALEKRVKAEKEAEELAGLTLKPKLTSMARRLQRSASCSDTWKRLMESGTLQTKERILSLQAEKEVAELQECTFRPIINPSSTRMIAERNLSITKQGRPQAHEVLYEDAARRQQKQATRAAALPSDYTFSPRILDSRSSSRNDVPAACVSERLYCLQQQRNARAEAAKWQSEHPVDPKTGLPLFKPQTGRGPAFERGNVRGQNIGQYLYSIRHRQDARKKQLTAEEKLRRAAAAVPHPLERSKALVAGLKAKRLSYIFSFLSSGAGTLDLLGLVNNSDSKRLSRLQADVRSDVESAAQLLAHGFVSRAGAEGACPPYSNSIDLATFTSLMEAVIASSKGVPRPYLLPNSSNKQEREEPSFSPTIDARSKVLAEKLRPKGLPAFEILHQAASQIHSRHIQQLQAQEDANMRECTFEPDTHWSRSKKAQSPRKPKALQSAARPTRALIADDQSFEDLEREVEEALKEGARLGLTGSSLASQSANLLASSESYSPPSGITAECQDCRYQVPAIQRWTSDNEDFVAEMCDEAATVYARLSELQSLPDEEALLRVGGRD